MMEKTLPKGWVKTELNNLFSLVIGGDWGIDPESSSTDGFIKVLCIRGSEIKNWREEKGKTAAIRLVKESSLLTRRLQIGDILLEISGGGPDQPVGRTLLIDNETLSIQPDIPKICTNFFRLVRLVDVVDKAFVNHYLQYFYNSGEVVKYQGGSNNLRNLKFNDYSTIKIPLPPLPTQQRIVAKLDSLFARIDQMKSSMERIPQLLKAFRQSVLTQAVTGKLTEEWREGKELEEWESKKLGTYITKIQAGKNFSCPEYPVTEDTVGLVKISAVTWGKFDPNETKTVIDKAMIFPDLFIKKGDFLISRANTLELVGASLIVDEIKFRIMLSDKIWRVSFCNQIDKFFVNYFLKSRIGREEIESRATGNQLSMRNISQDSFRDIDINYPPLQEQQEIVRRVESLFAKADRIEAQYQSLKAKIEQLPQALLAKAFRGELVEQLPEDGDARELLEALRQAQRPGKGEMKRSGTGKILRRAQDDTVLKQVAEPEGKYWGKK